MTSILFSPLQLRGVEFRNRAWVSPMCQYSAVDGVPNDWHLAHLGSFARGGAGLVFTESTAVLPEGRISAADTGLWNDEQASAWRRIVDFVHSQGTRAGVQLGHAGRTASVRPPWDGGAALPNADGGWSPLGPSALGFPRLRTDPRPATAENLAAVVGTFAAAARRAVTAGFDVVEVHAAHGYLLHEFLSPLTNDRTDEYGGSFDNRIRLLRETVRAVRAAVPDTMPVFVRVSTTDWTDGGWSVEETVRLAGRLRDEGVDLLDVSSAGNVAGAAVPEGPGYHVPFARRVRDEAGLPAGVVGVITEPKQAEEIVAGGDADAVLIGRAFLREPHWALRAAAELGVDEPWPRQYREAAP
jgi:2,4-dienoyl-CoA reductase-like NADH-dependent reductase (Old Yellow Enzyme family)